MVAAAGGLASDDQERAWSAEAASDQKAIIAKLALRGAAVDPEYSFTRVLNGFSAALDAGSIAVLERSPEVLGVYPGARHLPGHDRRRSRSAIRRR